MKKIMIVDDDPDIIFSIKAGLKSENNEFEIQSANNGTDCLNFLENNELPDLILLDIMMPDISGWKVYDELKNNPKWEDIAIIFLTARSDKVAKETGSFLGDDFIEKPFEIVDLMSRINLAIKKKNETSKSKISS